MSRRLAYFLMITVLTSSAWAAGLSSIHTENTDNPIAALSQTRFSFNVADALNFAQERTHFAVQGPAGLTGWEANLSVSVTANGHDYDVEYYPCDPPQLLNSPDLWRCVKSNQDIVGGFGGIKYASHAAALRAPWRCGVWTCEMGVQMCPRSAHSTTVDGVRVKECRYDRGHGYGEISWSRGTWSFVVFPQPYNVSSDVSSVIDEEKPLRLNKFHGLVQSDLGALDNANTNIMWTVGDVNYYVNFYLGQGLSDALTFEPLTPRQT